MSLIPIPWSLVSNPYSYSLIPDPLSLSLFPLSANLMTVNSQLNINRLKDRDKGKGTKGKRLEISSKD